jgi:spermidine/putrescine transport system ATP-binding protein
LGVRPEKLRLSTGDAQPAGYESVAGRITDASYAGVSTQYLVRTGWGTEVTVFAPNTGAEPPLTAGTEVVAYWDPAHAFLLDRAPADEVTA